jgi:pimeloyl-ACP methyl ester carboxylesterase
METAIALKTSNKSTIVLLWESFRKQGVGLASTLFPAVVARVCERWFFTPQRFSVPEREQWVLEQGEQLFVEVQGHRLAVWRWSIAERPYAPAVILLHGWSGRAGQLTPFVQPLLDAGFAVWAFDGPGHGASSGTQSSGVALALALLALSDQWGRPAGVIAHSIGGWAAAHAILLGADLPEAVLISAPDNPAAYLHQVSNALNLGAQASSQVMSLAEARLGMRYEQVALSHRLDRLSLPALIIHDRQDREIPLESGEKIARHWSGAQTFWTDGLGHRRILRDPQVIRSVVEFLKN